MRLILDLFLSVIWMNFNERQGSVTVLANDGHDLVPNYLRVNYLRNSNNWMPWYAMTRFPREGHPLST